MRKSVLVTGSNGQLGSELKALSGDYKEYEFLFVTREELDFSQPERMSEFFEERHFDILINCAAYTAVDKAESEETLADKINHIAVKKLAEISKAQEMSLIHISTDYVYDGKNYKPYVEDDDVSPQSVYGKTKLLGEKAILETKLQNSMVIRTSWVYSSFGNNFVKTMLKLGKQKDELGVVFDQIGTPTYAKDLAKGIIDLLPRLNNKETETYHYSNEGTCSWYDFAKSIFELSGVACYVKPIETKDYPTPAQRPFYSLLNKNKIKNKFDINIPYWRDSLQDCLDSLKVKK